ncbi:hypothetical protein B0H14DRAFT_3882097 [Mycena olivaceomarginata]|nr:hypothetical protein B0H14DRAFT_3882097 [Mycena olivaceomarginata]
MAVRVACAGDHGVENIEVAIYLEEVNGSGRGSFIWGRSVPNTRIERLWYDVTHGFGKKWKVFFLDLETNHGLNPTRSGHIWLLHHLFLASVHRDAQDWAEALELPPAHRSPPTRAQSAGLVPFGMLREGPRGISAFLMPEEEGIENINEYAILMRRATNSDPFASASTPANLSEVLCDPPGCPFTPGAAPASRRTAFHIG